MLMKDDKQTKKEGFACEACVCISMSFCILQEAINSTVSQG